MLYDSIYMAFYKAKVIDTNQYILEGKGGRMVSRIMKVRIF